MRATPTACGRPTVTGIERHTKLIADAVLATDVIRVSVTPHNLGSHETLLDLSQRLRKSQQA